MVRKCIKPVTVSRHADLFVPLTCSVLETLAPSGKTESFVMSTDQTNNLWPSRTPPAQHLPRILNEWRRELDARHGRHGAACCDAQAAFDTFATRSGLHQ
jgi:hypothetical protein